MLLNYQQALVPYNSVETIQMVPDATGYVPSNREEDSGNRELTYSSSEKRHNSLQLLDERHEEIYSWNRRITSFGMSDIGSHIDVYA